MRFKKGAEVFSGQGEKIGTLNRVILDPRTREVSDLVVGKGFLFKTDKVIPVTLVDLDVEDRIVLKKTNQDILDDFPNFETTYYIPVNDPDDPYQPDIEASYWYPPVHPEFKTGDVLPEPDFISETTEDIPEHMVALQQGARVISRDGQHVGNVEDIIAESPDHRITHFVVSAGFLLKERKLVPAVWIAQVDEQEIHLTVESGVFEHLPEYQTLD